MPPALAFNTAVSFVTNTNWQNYARREHRQPPHPDGRPGGAELRLGRGRASPWPSPSIRGLVRRRSATIGNFWVDLTRAATRILLPIAFVAAIVLVSQGVVQNLGGFTTAHDRRGGHPGRARRPGRQPGGHQGARAPTAAGFSTPTRPTRSRTPTGSPTCSSCSSSCSSRSPSPSPSGAWPRTSTQGWAVFARHVRAVARQRLVAMALRDRRQPRASTRPASTRRSRDRRGRRRELRGQGGPVRGRRRPACSRPRRPARRPGRSTRAHDSFTPAGGAVPARQHHAGRGQPRRGGRRPLRDAGLRHPGGVHRRAHGRADARSTWARRSRRPR